MPCTMRGVWMWAVVCVVMLISGASPTDACTCSVNVQAFTSSCLQFSLTWDQTPTINYITVRTASGTGMSYSAHYMSYNQYELTAPLPLNVYIDVNFNEAGLLPWGTGTTKTQYVVLHEYGMLGLVTRCSDTPPPIGPPPNSNTGIFPYIPTSNKTTTIIIICVVVGVALCCAVGCAAACCMSCFCCRVKQNHGDAHRFHTCLCCRSGFSCLCCRITEHRDSHDCHEVRVCVPEPHAPHCPPREQHWWQSRRWFFTSRTYEAPTTCPPHHHPCPPPHHPCPPPCAPHPWYSSWLYSWRTRRHHMHHHDHHPPPPCPPPCPPPPPPCPPRHHESRHGARHHHWWSSRWSMHRSSEPNRCHPCAPPPPPPPCGSAASSKWWSSHHHRSASEHFPPHPPHSHHSRHLSAMPPSSMAPSSRPHPPPAHPPHSRHLSELPPSRPYPYPLVVSDPVTQHAAPPPTRVGVAATPSSHRRTHSSHVGAAPAPNGLPPPREMETVLEHGHSRTQSLSPGAGITLAPLSGATSPAEPGSRATSPPPAAMANGAPNGQSVVAAPAPLQLQPMAQPGEGSFVVMDNKEIGTSTAKDILTNAQMNQPCSPPPPAAAGAYSAAAPAPMMAVTPGVARSPKNSDAAFHAV